MWKYNELQHNDWWAYLDRQDELSHYGVKGMKWKNRKRYSDELFGHSTTISVGGSSNTTYTPGQIDKWSDKTSAKNKVRTAVNTTNPYKWNSNKSVSKNVKSNANTYKRRRKLKKFGYKAVDRLFRNL